MSNSLKCFVPNMLVDMINTDLVVGKDYIEPLSIFMNAVCLVVDISGFTRLSGEFCKMGKDGIDQLQLATNGYMGQLVDIIYGYGGEIIKFAGDAIICIFASRTSMRSSASFGKIARSNSNVSEASEPSWVMSKGSTKSGAMELPPLTADIIVSALQCAQELRFVQTEKLTAHVAISSGEICFGILGGYENKWECLISGPCIQELSGCLDDAPSKQAAISKDCAKTLLAASSIIESSGEIHGKTILPEGICEFALTALPSGNCRIDSVACTAGARLAGRSSSLTASMASSAASQKHPMTDRALELLRQFVPASVADKLDTEAELNNLAEMREVTTMFMKWDSYDAASMHRDLLMLQPHFYEVQKALQSTGAFLRQFLVDDKGCVLIACWGMPNLSYLDNASRAVSTAAQIHRKMIAMDMKCSFGITTGDVYCGTVGSDLRMEYAAIGSVVNMAARLMGKAHGGIYIDDTTYERLSPDAAASLIALEPIKVKGREEPLPVYEYASGTSIKVQEKVVDDSAIPPFKREAMINFLATMLEKDDELSCPAVPSEDDRSQGGQSPPPRGWWSLVSENSGGGRIHDAVGKYRVRNVCTIPLQILLIKGRDGSGKTTVVKWIRKKAQDRGIPVCCLKVTPKDAQTQYLIFRRLFQMLMPKDLFVSPDAQRTHVHKLLNEIYPDVSRSVRKLKFAVFKQVLGISCSYSRLRSSKSAHNGVWFPREVFRRDPDAAISTSTILEVLYDVFAHLLNAEVSLLVIENIENADDGSLRVLCSLLKLRTRSAIVLTALKEISLEKPAHSQLSSRFRTRAVRQDALHSTLWTKKYKCIVQCHRCTHVIFLEPFRAAEIERLLATTLHLQTVPEELTKLVQDYSGGSCFWVLELLQFITEHGADYFMNALGDHEEASPEKVVDPATVRRRSSNNAAKVASKMNSIRSSMSPLSPEERRHQKQLDKLVLCRFGNLSPDVQRVLRTASIIGMSFSRPLLSAVLPAPLRATLGESIQALVTLKWLHQDIDNESLFQFAHVHSRQLIYDLTPSSERSTTHQHIAEYMEATFPDDKATYPLLSYHYQQCDPARSLAYTTKAVQVLLQVESVFDFVECLDLLSGAVNCCQNAQDAVALHGLINQAQITIVMFTMNQGIERKKHHKRHFNLRPWAMICGGPCAVVPTDHDDHHEHDHHHDHDHDHDHGDGHVHHHDHDQCDPNSHKCPCKQEEAEDAELEHTYLARAGENPELAQEEKQISEEARTKKVFLRYLQEISDQLTEAKAAMETEVRATPSPTP